MSIATYAQLQAAAANWLVRNDLTARIPEFITLAEARLNRVLRTRLAAVEVALAATPGGRTIPLPSAFGEALAVWITEGGERRSLPFIEAGLMGVSSLQGRPGAWAIDGANVVFDRPCDQAYGVTLRMLAKLLLSDVAPTNGLLSEYPDAYLFATLCEAAPFLRDAELAGAYEARLQRALSEINSKDARARAARTLATEVPLASEAFDIDKGVCSASARCRARRIARRFWDGPSGSARRRWAWPTTTTAQSLGAGCSPPRSFRKPDLRRRRSRFERAHGRPGVSPPNRVTVRCLSSDVLVVATSDSTPVKTSQPTEFSGATRVMRSA